MNTLYSTTDVVLWIRWRSMVDAVDVPDTRRTKTWSEYGPAPNRPSFVFSLRGISPLVFPPHRPPRPKANTELKAKFIYAMQPTLTVPTSEAEESASELYGGELFMPLLLPLES